MASSSHLMQAHLLSLSLSLCCCCCAAAAAAAFIIGRERQ
jgi:hypothetical protein